VDRSRSLIVAVGREFESAKERARERKGGVYTKPSLCPETRIIYSIVTFELLRSINFVDDVGFGVEARWIRGNQLPSVLRWLTELTPSLGARCVFQCCHCCVGICRRFLECSFLLDVRLLKSSGGYIQGSFDQYPCIIGVYPL
jgi:hypothetical protein